MSPSNFFRPFLPAWFAPPETAPVKFSEHCPAKHDGLDVILLFGAGVGHEAKFHADEACRRLNLSSEAFDIAGAGSMETLRLHLRSGGKLGPDTQLFLVCHGSVHGAGQHRLTVMSPSSAYASMPTTEVLRALRQGIQEDGGSGNCPAWRGTIHLISCGAGQLASEILPGSEAWNEGSCILHASDETLLVHEGIQAITQSLACVAQCRENGAAPDPRQMLAHAAHRTGDAVMLLGCAVTSVASVRVPPPGPEDARLLQAGGWLKTRTELGLAENKGIVGLQAHPDDASAILATLSTLDEQPTLQEARLREQRMQDILLTSVSHHSFDTVSMLLEARPDLAEARSLTGRTVEQLALKKGNEAIIQAVVATRLSNVGPQTLLFQACARGDHDMAQRLLHIVEPGQLSTSDITLAMELASENVADSQRFFSGLLDAAGMVGNKAARRCLMLAHQARVLPDACCTLWKLYKSANAAQLDNDRRSFLCEEAEAGELPGLLMDACRDGDAMLLSMLLQRCPLAPGMTANRQRLIGYALGHGNSAELLARLTESAQLHQDMATFHALGADAASLPFLRQHGRALLEQACIGDSTQVAAYLLERNEIHQGPDTFGTTLLHLAAGSDSVGLIALLLRQGHEVDRKDHLGETALHAACREGQDAAVAQLLLAGAKTGITNVAGETALDLARANCSSETIALLGRQAT